MESSKEENEFPLAFSIVMYKDPEQVVRLLRMIYRPSNYYCIHVDSKAQDGVFAAMESVSQCFPNVVMASTRHDVRWGEFRYTTSMIQYQPGLTLRSLGESLLYIRAPFKFHLKA